MMDYEQSFNSSYWRVVPRQINDSNFEDAFYERFMADSQEVAEAFLGVDMDTLKKMFVLSLLHVSDFYSQDKPNRLLQDFALDHQQRCISPHLFDVWLDNILQTVEEYDPEFSPQIKEAWRQVLTPGVEYMKTQCAALP